MREWVVLAYEEHLRVVDVPDVDAAGEDIDPEWRVVLDALEGADSGRIDLLAEDGDIGYTGEESRNGGGGAIHVVLQLHVRLELLEVLLPKHYELAHPCGLCTAMAGNSDYSADLLLGNVVRKGGDYLILVGSTVITTGACWLDCSNLCSSCTGRDTSLRPCGSTSEYCYKKCDASDSIANMRHTKAPGSARTRPITSAYDY